MTKPDPHYFKLAAAFLCLAMVLNCTSQVTGIQPPPTVDWRVTYKDALNSTVRISIYDASGRLDGYGSGTVIGTGRNHYVILTNAHIAGPNMENSLVVEFWQNGHSLGKHSATTAYSILKEDRSTLLGEGDVDMAVCYVPFNKVLRGKVKVTPLTSWELHPKPDTEIFQAGCDGAKNPNGSIGRVLAKCGENLFYYSPQCYPGDSGSAVFNRSGTEVIGLTAWYSTLNGEFVGRAMNVGLIKQHLKDFNYAAPKREQQKPDELGPLRDWLRRRLSHYEAEIVGIKRAHSEEVKQLKERISEYESQSIELQEEIKKIEQIESGLFDRLRRRFEDGQLERELRDQERRDKYIESLGIVGRLQHQFGGLLGKIRLMIGLIVVLSLITFITLFVGPGWLTILLTRIVTTFIRLIVAAWHVIKKSVTTELAVKQAHEFDSFDERFDHVQEEVKDAASK